MKALEEVYCSVCKASENIDVLTVYDRKNDFYKCPRCGAEIWIDQEKLQMIYTQKKTEELTSRLNEQVRWAVGGRFTEVNPLVLVTNRKKRSGSKSGRRRKKPVKRLKRNLFYDT